MKVTNIRGYKIIGKQLSHWEKIFKIWLSFVQDYCDRMKEIDNLFIQTERANVGIFASAAWKAGFLALEAFNERKRSKLWGRCDLYLFSDIEGVEREEYIEAKLYYPSLRNINIKTLKIYFTRAEKAAKELLGVDSRVSLLFITPYIYEKYKNNISSRIEEIIKEIIKDSGKIKYDAMAWSFPASTRFVKLGEKPGKIIYPGVFLFAKIVS